MHHGEAVGHVGEQAGVTARTACRQRRGRHDFAQPGAAMCSVLRRTAHRGGASATSASGARRREGLTPNGRDDEDGTGRSPKARRRMAPTRTKRAYIDRKVNRMTIHIRNETDSDAAAIEAVTAAAFRDAPHTDHTEQFIVRALRAAGELTVSLVAETEGRIVGHVAVSPVTLSDGSGDWYGLGPISVLPAHQGQGIGSQLMERALSDLRARHAAGCVVLGDPGYYTRFGFKPESALQLPDVPPEYFMALVFRGAMPAGRVTYSQAFSATA